MIWIGLGTSAFVFFFLFEFEKCKKYRAQRTGMNPWFIVGTVVFLFSYVMLCIESGIRTDMMLFPCIGLVVWAICTYATILFKSLQKEIYVEDFTDRHVVRRGIYGKMRHPGVWGFFLCNLTMGFLFPGVMLPGLWFSIWNLFYTWCQDRFFFPVYLEGYPEYRKEVPFLAFWK